MPVPEAAMHEDHCVVPWQYYIGRAGQVPAMQPEAVAHSVHNGSHDTLRFHVAGTYP